ncbi:MAG: ABC transporter permease [Bacteroidales bacterium]|jgi:putative ABC transport system permease protein|nr:ABC transporter permease [Bacteroidales bacterium]
MFKNIIKHSFRSFNRQKGYTAINILGLSIGIACSLLISLYVVYELSYDQFHEKKERIYRLVLDGKIGGQEVIGAYTSAPAGPAMLEEFPEVENFVRLNTRGETVIKLKEKHFSINNYTEADSSFFKMFSFPLFQGNINTVLNEPYKVVLSKSTAIKIFGTNDPMGQMIKIGNDTSLYRVSGIFEDLPDNSHIEADLISSFTSNARALRSDWLSNSYATYLLLKPGTSQQDVEDKIPGLIAKYVGPLLQQFLGIELDEFLSNGNRYSMFLQPLNKIHLQPEIQQETKPANNPKYLYIFGSIALLIIIIAAINFMNLATAQAAKRAKEVGIKKVSGSSRGLLISQFLTESVLLSFIALVVALLVIQLSFPYFNKLLGVKLAFTGFNPWYTLPALIILSLLTGILAGSYPAFFLSAFKPVNVLKGKTRDAMKNGKLRSILVILQFSISIVLIIGSMIMYSQLTFMQQKDLGFDKQQLLVIQRAEVLGNKVQSFKEELLNQKGVEKVTASTALPAFNNNNNGHMVEGRTDETLLLETNWVDYDYLETLGLQMSSGRFFDRDYPTDVDACVINETAVNHYHFNHPLETRFLKGNNINDVEYVPVIGVVKDFHFRSLQTPITPYIFIFKDENINWGYVTARISTENIQTTLKNIETVWKNFTGNEPIQYFFLDRAFNNLYKEESRNAKLAIIFTTLAIFIASLGLLGLTSYTTEQRTKEIGIRKAMGASSGSILYLISREIISLLLISTLIAWPTIYFIATRWLQNYQYRIDLSFTYFLAGLLIAIVIALVTISYKTIQSARLNPTNCLRYE